LIAAKSDLNLKDKDGNTALILAADKGHTDIVKALIAANADLNLQNKNRDTALTVATDKGHLKNVKSLIAANADLNIQTQSGDTALILAANKGHTDIVKDLLVAQAPSSLLIAVAVFVTLSLSIKFLDAYMRNLYNLIQEVIQNVKKEINQYRIRDLDWGKRILTLENPHQLPDSLWPLLAMSKLFQDTNPLGETGQDVAEMEDGSIKKLRTNFIQSELLTPDLHLSPSRTLPFSALNAHQQDLFLTHLFNALGHFLFKPVKNFGVPNGNRFYSGLPKFDHPHFRKIGDVYTPLLTALAENNEPRILTLLEKCPYLLFFLPPTFYDKEEFIVQAGLRCPISFENLPESPVYIEADEQNKASEKQVYNQNSLHQHLITRNINPLIPNQSVEPNHIKDHRLAQAVWIRKQTQNQPEDARERALNEFFDIFFRRA